MSLQTILDSLSCPSDSLEATAVIPPGWGQGRATFGGLVAALMQQHLDNSIGGGRTLRSASITFVGPAAAGEITLRSELIRRGKSVLQAECRAWQGGQVVAMLVACFGAARDSRLAIPAAAAPTFRAPEDCQALPWIPGVVPDFTQQFDFRWHQGDLPFSRGERADIGGWVRLRTPVERISPAMVMALVDAWPPTVIGMFDSPAPVSTLSWSMEFLSPTQAIPHDGWWQYLADTDTARDGYVHAHSSLWSPGGELVAISRQTVTVFY